MKQPILVAAMLLCGSLLGIAPASPASAAPVSTVSHRCVAPWDQAVEPSNPGWAEADWEGQTCNFTMHVRAKCANRFTSVLEYSGKVSGNEKEDRAACTTSFPQIQRADINFEESGFWIGWCEIWPVYNNCHT